MIFDRKKKRNGYKLYKGPNGRGEALAGLKHSFFLIQPKGRQQFQPFWQHQFLVLPLRKKVFGSLKSPPKEYREVGHRRRSFHPVAPPSRFLGARPYCESRTTRPGTAIFSSVVLTRSGRHLCSLCEQSETLPSQWTRCSSLPSLRNSS